MEFVASKEHDRGSHPKQEGSQEGERSPYYRAARFKTKRLAGKANFQAQDAIYEDLDCELSAYRFQLHQIYHVAVLADSPTEDLEQTLQAILAAGESVSLPPDILKLVTERRSQVIKKGPWVESHYQPGKNP
jgi:hypothetical protein